MTIQIARVARICVSLGVLSILGFIAYEIAENPTNQIFGRTFDNGPVDRRVVALTYDDGPNPPYTDRILDVLRAERVHATFFLVGRAVVAYPKTVRREVSEGNAVGNHTWNHGHLIVMNRAQIRSTLERTGAAIFAASGVHTRLMRPPYGARDWVVLRAVRRLGYTPVMWSVPLAYDWQYPSARTIANRVLPYVHDGAIIVLHDGNRGLACGRLHLPQHQCDRSSDIEATRLIVEALKAKGYRFVTIPQLLALGRATHTSAPGNE